MSPKGVFTVLFNRWDNDHCIVGLRDNQIKDQLEESIIILGNGKAPNLLFLISLIATLRNKFTEDFRDPCSINKPKDACMKTINLFSKENEKKNLSRESCKRIYVILVNLLVLRFNI